ncbi:hypothetical protein Cgig2_025338 [Carnegiea gigantea]|uniref:Uncharacterized protein n=1 Tax=Carnegiea gigantea TaxID=171969 RepID=A0A9Q1JRV7_9CARY|nr:hypothetical protein Cgig2_025338 [Carnegiea gigantea]
MVREMTGSDMVEEKLWYTLKYDGEMLVVVEGDSDMKVIFKGNDEHGYMYVAGNSDLVAKRMGILLVCNNYRSLGSAREDAGDEETTKEDETGDKQAAEKRYVDGNKRKGCAVGNDVNDILVSGHLEKLGKKMDKHKTETLKWKNGMGERIEQKLADAYKKMGRITAVECYSLMLGEYSVELTNSRQLVIKLGQ